MNELSQLWQFLGQLEGKHWLAIAGIAYVAYYYRGWIFEQFAKVKLPSAPAPTPIAAPVIDEDAAEFQSLHKLRKRFERNKCKEGIQAVDVCLTHFFHSEGQ
jgi:hypothetical protein